MYGRQSRNALQGFVPIPYALHARDYVKAVNGRGPWHDEVLVEEHADGTVTLLPSDAFSYGSRTIWRKARRKRGNGNAAEV